MKPGNNRILNYRFDNRPINRRLQLWVVAKAAEGEAREGSGEEVR